MLILASESPRRRALLAQLGVAFRVEAAAVDERRLAGETPAAMATRLALLKARTVAARHGLRGDGGDGDGDCVDGAESPSAVLAGDTVVAVAGDSLGKPAERAQAVAMLRRLSGNLHTVYTAVALVTGTRAAARLSATQVTFARLDARDIERYCDTDAPYDKAGGYGIQGAAGAFVTRIDGSYSGVVGLPLWETRELLREFGRMTESNGPPLPSS